MQLSINKLNFSLNIKNKLAGLVCLSLLVLCLFEIFTLYRGFILPKNDQFELIQMPIKIDNLPSIANMHLFGDYQSDSSRLPNTTLQLKLQGILLSNDPTQSRAIIAQNSATPKVYEIGQSVPGGAVIKAIDKNQVILNYNNQLESLRLPVPK